MRASHGDDAWRFEREHRRGAAEGPGDEIGHALKSGVVVMDHAERSEEHRIDLAFGARRTGELRQRRRAHLGFDRHRVERHVVELGVPRDLLPRAARDKLDVVVLDQSRRDSVEGALVADDNRPRHPRISVTRCTKDSRDHNRRAKKGGGSWGRGWFLNRGRGRRGSLARFRETRHE
jgi:hypothetical protein